MVTFAILVLLTFLKHESKVETKTLIEGDIQNFCFNDSCVEKDGSRWWVKKEEIKQPANKEKVENYIDKFKKLKLGTKVSNNKNKESAFGFDNTQVKLTINKKSMLIGGIESNFTGSYIKLIDSDDVYLTNVVIDRDFDLVDLTITKWPKENVKKIVATNGIRQTVINNKDVIFVNKLVNLNGLKYLGPIDKEKAKAIKIVINDGEYNLIIGTIGNTYFAMNREDDYYEISKDDFFALRSKIR